MKKTNSSRNIMAKLNRSLSDVSFEIKNLLTQYQTLKKERIKKELDSKLLNNKVQLLQNETVKKRKKNISQEKALDKYNLIRVNVLTQKRLLEKNKEREATQFQKQAERAKEISDQVNSTLQNWRGNVKEKNQIEGIKVKRERAEIDKIKSFLKEEISSSKKQMHDRVVYLQCETEKNQIALKKQKNRKMRSILEKEIKNEVIKINKINHRLQQYQTESKKILTRMNSNQPSQSGSKVEVRRMKVSSSCKNIRV